MDTECCRFLRDGGGDRGGRDCRSASASPRDGPFDVVAMWQVIEHLPNPREVLAAAAGSLAPGGVVVIATPNPAAFQFRVFGPRWTHLDAPRHLFLISAPTLSGVGRELGLETALLTTAIRHARLELVRVARVAGGLRARTRRTACAWWGQSSLV